MLNRLPAGEEDIIPIQATIEIVQATSKLKAAEQELENCLSKIVDADYVMIAKADLLRVVSIAPLSDYSVNQIIHILPTYYQTIGRLILDSYKELPQETKRELRRTLKAYGQLLALKRAGISFGMREVSPLTL